jgi:hypothetical protein
MKNHCRIGAAGVASPRNQPSGKMDMKTYVLNETTASTDIRKIKMGRAKRPVWKSSLPCGSGSALLSTYHGRPTGFDPQTL